MLKKVLIALLIAFGVYFLLTDPAALAGAFRWAGETVVGLFEAVVIFFTELF